MSKEYDEYMARKKADRDARIQARLDGEAAEEKFGKAMDREFEKGISDLLGGASLSDLQKAYSQTRDEATKHEADLMRQINKAYSKGNTSKVTKIVKKNKGTLKKVSKRKKGCGLFAIMFLVIGLAILGGASYGAVAVATALF